MACPLEGDKMEDQNRLILVVDDFKDDRDMYAQFLSLKGFRVVAAADGEEALDKAAQLQPDLIIMDLWMPRISGWEAIRRLKINGRTRHIPIVVLTARAFVSAKAVGSEGCLIKPCDLDEMLAEVTRIIDQQDKSGQLSPPHAVSRGT
ncbi:MAG TPA: response regulator [Terriglobia bacterium]|nr:response regulator [Terriglobia bacterium]